jgi:hypothetical protein
VNAESEDRNAWGFPPIEVTAQERANQTTQVDQSVRKNDALPWVFVAGVIGACALGMGIANQGRIDDLSTFYQQRMSATQQQADLLTYYVMELDGKLMQRQLIKPEESFAGQRRQRAQSKSESKSEREKRK